MQAYRLLCKGADLLYDLLKSPVFLYPSFYLIGHPDGDVDAPGAPVLSPSSPRLVTAYAVCFLPVRLQRHSGFAHFQRFTTKEPHMNVPTSPRELIFAAIINYIVFRRVKRLKLTDL